MTPSPNRRPVVKALGMLGAVLSTIVGLGLLAAAVYLQFGVVANFNQHSKPDDLYDSAGAKPLVLTAPYGSYGITSMDGALQACSLSPGSGGVAISPVLDPKVTKRPVLRFDAPAGTYTIACSPDLWFQVFHGKDVVRAAQGFDGDVHPSIYFGAAAVGTLLLGSFLWNRFVQRPRDWAYTPDR